MMSELIESAEATQNDQVLNLKIRNIKKVAKRSSTANNASRQRPDHQPQVWSSNAYTDDNESENIEIMMKSKD